MKKRLVSAILSAVLLTTLVSCSNNQLPENNNAEQGGEDTSQSADTSSEGEKSDESEAYDSSYDASYDELYSDLPTGNYDGWEFVMLNNISNFAYTMMTAEDLTGDNINDAIYNRNIKVSEALNILITEDRKAYGDVTSTMKKELTANTDTYPCFWNESKFVAPFAGEGSLYNVNEISTLNLSKPWWNSSAMEDVTIADRLYYLVGDLHLMFKEAYWVTGFNKNILNDYSLDDPYQLVKEGTWTLETLVKLMDAVDEDLNGNGVMDAEDRFGGVCYDASIKPLLFATGEKLMVKNEEGIPTIETPSDRFYTVFTDIINGIYSTNLSYTCLNGRTQGMEKYSWWGNLFKDGKSLFIFEALGSYKQLRDMDAEFGIVPYPKYDETQDKYISLIAEYAAFCGIPKTNLDTEKTGVILENLCAESFGGLSQAYAEETLNFKYIRDKESIEMLNIIFENGVFNLADVFAITSLSSTLNQCAINGSADIASKYASVQKVSNKLLEKMVKGMLGE